MVRTPFFLVNSYSGRRPRAACEHLFVHWWNPQVALMMSLPGLHMCVRTDVTHPSPLPQHGARLPHAQHLLAHRRSCTHRLRRRLRGMQALYLRELGDRRTGKYGEAPRGGCFFLLAAAHEEKKKARIRKDCGQHESTLHFLVLSPVCSSSIVRRLRLCTNQCGTTHKIHATALWAQHTDTLTHTHTHPPGPASDEDSGSRGSPFSPRESRDPLQEAHHLPLPGASPVPAPISSGGARGGRFCLGATTPGRMLPKG